MMKKMFNYLKVVFRLKSYVKYNMLVYYVQKIPVIGGYISRFLLSCTRLKDMVALLLYLFSVIGSAVVRFASIIIFIQVPFLWYSNKMNIVIANYSSYYFQAIFFFFCILGSFQESRTFLVSKIKYICFVQIKMPVQKGILSFLCIEYISQFISAIIAFSLCGKFLFHSGLTVLMLAVSYVAFQLLSESIHLAVFKKTRIPLEKNKAFSIILLVVSLIGAYGPIFVTNRLLIVDQLKTSFFIIVMAMVIIINIYYITVAYSGYTYKLAYFFKKDDLLEERTRRKHQEIFDSDIEINLAYPKNMKKLTGFQLLNSIFVVRNKKQLYKYLKRRIIAGLIAVAYCLFCLFNDFDMTQHILRNIYSFSSLLPVIICQYAYGEGYCKYYYNNCDSTLLSYVFYRTKYAIRSNYFLKIKEVSKCNLVLWIVTCIYLILVFKIAKISFFNTKFLLLIVTALVLLIVFGIHHVSIYYLLQPYVKDSIVHNPVIVAVQMPLVIFMYLLAMLNLDPSIVMIVLIVTSVIYALILILNVWIKGVKTFKLK